MKKINRGFAMILAIMMLITLPGVETMASDVGSGVNVENTEQTALNEVNSEKTDDATAAKDQSSSEESSSVDSNVNIESQLAYVYINQNVVRIPETQNIAVGFSDTEKIVEKATLNYRSTVSNQEMSMEASNIIQGAVLFTQEYLTGPMEDEFVLEGITYQESGKAEQTILFKDEKIEASYRITVEPETVESETNVTAYTVDELGNTVIKSEDTIEETVESVLDKSETAVDATMSNATDLNNNKVGLLDTIKNIVGMSNVKAADTNGNLVVALSAGHDATHIGASANGLAEETLNLKVAQYCKEELEQYSGVTVYMTRSSASCPYPGTTKSEDNMKRIDAAINNKADVYVDIHFNAGGGNGSEVYYPNSSYNLSVSNNGEDLANSILEQLKKLGLTNRGAKTRDATDGEADSNGVLADYYTTNNYCKEKGIPGIIVEHAFLDGAADAVKLTDEAFIKSLGIADATGIANKYGLARVGSKPTISSVNIANKNDFNGTFSIKLTGVRPSTNIKKVEVAVWSDVGGQDDLVWYTAADNGNGAYSVVVDTIKNHKSSVGLYYEHVYITDAAGMLQPMAGSTTCIMASSSATTSVGLSADKTQIVANTTVTNVPTGLTSIKYAVWSSVDGQNDLRWYTGTNSGNVWSSTFSLSNHKSYGTYNIHAYAAMSDESMIMLNAKTIDIPSPTASTISVVNQNTNEGTFDVVINGITSPLGISKIEIPVWCSSNQSDINWYTATKQSDGSYKATVNMANHKYAEGTYIAHVYLTDGSGVRSFLGATNSIMTLPKTTVTATKTSAEEKQFSLQAQGVVIPGGVSKVQFAVWSEANGQDDLHWYDAIQSTSGTYKYTMLTSTHKSIGTYFVHAYAITGSGMKLLGTTTFTVASPKVTSVIASNFNENTGMFDVLISGVSAPSGVKTVTVPVWCADNQSDIYWYQATNQGNGIYKMTVNISNHKYTEGNYKIHVYVADGNGIFAFCKETSMLVSLPKATVSATKVDNTEMQYQLKAEGVICPGGISNVQFAVWSENNGQDDLKWYPAVKNSVGVYSYNMSIGTHKSLGRYYAHAYATTTSGIKLIGTTTFTVTSPTVASMTANNYNVSTGTVDILIEGVNSPSGVKTVTVPVWCTDNQSDIYWYQATKQSEGTYKVTINVVNHNYSEGDYKAHVYVTDGNGIFSFCKSLSIPIALSSATISAVKTDDTEMEYLLQAQNVMATGGITKLQFAVWSSVGGQDDLQWYDSKQNSTGAWTSRVSISNHKSAGTYFVHTYVTTPNGLKKIGMTTFVVSTPSASSILIQNYNSNNGEFDVVVNGIISPSGVSSVQIPVWCAPDQSDIKWYKAVKQSDGSYKAIVDPINHGNHSGIYQIHTYLTTGYGMMALLGMKTQLVSAPALYTIMGTSTINVAQMISYYESNSTINYPSDSLSPGGASTLAQFCQIYYEEAQAEGVRAEVAFAQGMLETGFLKFGGDVKIGQYNFAGLGAIGNGEPGNSFIDVRTGVRAQVQHLKCYGSSDPLVQARVDLRWSEALRNKAPYVQWLSIPINPYGTGWASDPYYGAKLINIISEIKKK